jgi:hypothetical protein
MDKAQISIANEEHRHYGQAACRDSAPADGPRRDGDNPHQEAGLECQRPDRERQCGPDVHPDSTSRLREVEYDQTQDHDLEEMVDGKRFLYRAAERVQSDEYDQRDCGRSEVHRRSHAQGAREKQNRGDDQKRVKAAINGPVMAALCEVEQSFDLSDPQRAEIRLAAEAINERRRHRG